MAFGKPALSAMVALAHQGGTAFEQFGIQVGRVGGAAALAAAESKGLGGAMRGLGKQITRRSCRCTWGSPGPGEDHPQDDVVSQQCAIPYIKRGIRTATDLWDIYGPTVEAKLHAPDGGIGGRGRMVDPLKAALASVAAMPRHHLASRPVGALARPQRRVRGPAADRRPARHGRLGVRGRAPSAFLPAACRSASGASGHAGVLRPLGAGGRPCARVRRPARPDPAVSLLAMLAMRPFRGQIQGMQAAVTRFGRAGVTAFRGIGDASLYQRVQAANAGVTLGRFGGIVAELERRSPTFAAMATSFRSVSTSIEEAGGRLSGFRGAGRRGGRRMGTGARPRPARRGSRSLWSFLGGPWGVAIAGAMIGLDMLAKRQQEAAAAAAAHQARISSLTQALQQSNGVINGSVRASVVQTLADAKLKDGKTQLLDVMKNAGTSAHCSSRTPTSGRAPASTAYARSSSPAADENTRFTTNGKTTQKVYTPPWGDLQAGGRRPRRPVRRVPRRDPAKQKDLGGDRGRDRRDQ
jgi:hypothetical protein